jgi:hypothetical protein
MVPHTAPPIIPLPRKRKQSRMRTAAESVGLTVAVVVALILLGLVLDYAVPGVFGGDDQLPASSP